jgi:hypothetical protein
MTRSAPRRAGALETRTNTPLYGLAQYSPGRAGGVMSRWAAFDGRCRGWWCSPLGSRRWICPLWAASQGPGFNLWAAAGRRGGVLLSSVFVLFLAWFIAGRTFVGCGRAGGSAWVGNWFGSGGGPARISLKSAGRNVAPAKRRDLASRKGHGGHCQVEPFRPR